MLKDRNLMRKTTRALPVFFLLFLSLQGYALAQSGSVTGAQQAFLDHITARSLAGHLEFIASDELLGRATPSPGLNLAALYIATQFKRIGLEPVGDDGYYQTSKWVLTTIERERTLPSGEKRVFRYTWLAPVKGAVEPEGESFVLKNVVGLLPGSDPQLRDTYILVTAHYDHIGIRSGAYPDSICNGANDNGSSTVAVIELAEALASMPARPRRSILFMTFFGEERGLLGSGHYAEHPVVPLEKTIAMVNMEMIGRTDGEGGDQTNRTSFTGFDYSDLPLTFVEAGRQLGIEVFHHEQNSGPYFMRSDNRALAAKGIPSHTVCVTYSYEDYHQPGDNPDKIDYENMARTTRMLALGLIRLANSSQEPRWDEDNPQAASYLEAWRALHGKG